MSPHFGYISVYFYILDRSTVSPGLARVALSGRCLVGPGGAVPSVHQSQVLQRCPSVGCMSPFIVVGLRLLQACCWVGLTFRPADCEAGPWQQWTSYCVGAGRVGVLWWGSGASQGSLFGL